MKQADLLNTLVRYLRTIICSKWSCLLVFISFNFSSLFALARWMEDDEGSFVAFLYPTYQTDAFWNEKGKSLPAFNHFKKQAYLGYLQVQPHPRHALFTLGGYSRIQEEINGRTIGWKDTELGWKFLVYQQACRKVWSQLSLFIPSGSTKSSLRYGKTAEELSFLYTDVLSFQQKIIWCDVRLGYRHYQGWPSSQLLGRAKIGSYLLQGLYLEVGTDFLCSMRKPSRQFNDNLIIHSSSFWLWGIAMQATYVWKNYLGLSVGYERHLKGYCVGKGQTILGRAIWYF